MIKLKSTDILEFKKLGFMREINCGYNIYVRGQIKVTFANNPIITINDKNGIIRLSYLCKEDYVTDDQIKKLCEFMHIPFEKEKLSGIWIARDKDETLNLYIEEPILENDQYIPSDEYNSFICLPSSMYKEVTFKSGPKLIFN